MGPWGRQALSGPQTEYPPIRSPQPTLATHPHRPSVTEGMQWQLGPDHKTETPRTRMLGREVPHEREKPKQATGCEGGGGVGGVREGGGGAQRKRELVTQPAVCGTRCCQRKQIPQAGLSPCGGGIISSLKWQQRETMWSGLSRQSGLCQGSARLPGEPGSRRGCLVSPCRREHPPPP